MTTDTDTKDFLGTPIEGDVHRDSPLHVPQKSPEKLKALFEKVFASGEVEAVRWQQYTPHFNDGDPCVFSAGEVYFSRTQDEPDDWDEWDHGTYDDPINGRTAYEVRSTWTSSYNSHTYQGTEDKVSEETFLALKELNSDIQGGSYDNTLLQFFGDHSTILVTKDKISVSEYFHD
jgi:hypothetical protein